MAGGKHNERQSRGDRPVGSAGAVGREACGPALVTGAAGREACGPALVTAAAGRVACGPALVTGAAGREGCGPALVTAAAGRVACGGALVTGAAGSVAGDPALLAMAPRGEAGWRGRGTARADQQDVVTTCRVPSSMEMDSGPSAVPRGRSSPGSGPSAPVLPPGARWTRQTRSRGRQEGRKPGGGVCIPCEGTSAGLREFVDQTVRLKSRP